MTRRSRWTSGSVLVIISGLLIALVAVRWWRPCLGDFDSAVCELLQSDTHEPIAPTGRWEPIAGTTLPAAAALLILAAAIVIMASTLDVRRTRQAVIALVTASVPVVFGVLTLGAQIRGRSWPEAWGYLSLVVWLGSLASVLVLLPVANAGRGAIARVTVLWALGCTFGIGSLIDFLISSLWYGSYDFSPGYLLPTAAFLVLTGGALLVLSLRRSTSRTSPAVAAGNPLERAADR